MSNTCNQCKEQMTIYAGNKLASLAIASVCDNPICPNYGILQISIEHMMELKGNKNEN